MSPYPSSRQILLAARVVAGAVCLHVALASGCGKPPPADEPAASGAQAQAWTGEDPIMLWDKGKHDAALEALGAWARLGDPPPLVEAMSEREFTSLAPDRRQQVLSKVMRQQRAMREMAREIDRRARAALAAGDRATARSLAHTLKALATAHQGEHVLEITNLVGQAIQQVADGLLRDIGG